MTCIVCGGDRFRSLVDPQPSTSMLSDFAIVRRPLGKLGCLDCGLTIGNPPPDHEATFGADYALYAHEPGDPHEVARQTGYARWLSTALSPPASMFEAGAGNGSLLLALRDVWPDARASGVEAAGGAVARATAAGIAIEHGFLETARPGRGRHELALAINVIEHTRDPIAFVRDLATHGTSVAIVCPDGDAATSELLVADHLFSFGRSHVRSILDASDLHIVRQESAPKELGSFFMTIASAGTAPFEMSWDPEITHIKNDYLEAWRGLDDLLERRLGPRVRVGCFGAGEAAALLRAYAPATWERIELCVMDGPSTDTFAGKPVAAYGARDDIDVFVAATRPAAQAAVAARLERDGRRVVRYDDIIGA